MNASELFGTLASTTVVIPVGLTEPPWTISLTSVAAGRKIEISVDKGLTYFEPTLDADGTSSAQAVLTVTSPITHVRLTGSIGDSWRVL